jgi:hypothetical protein
MSSVVVITLHAVTQGIIASAGRCANITESQLRVTMMMALRERVPLFRCESSTTFYRFVFCDC